MVRAVPFDDPDDHRAAIAKANHGHLRALGYRQAQDPRLGGEALIGYVDDRPVGTTGWFIVDGVARFRPVSTIASYRRRGVATTLIRYVQDHPAVAAADGLVIYCSDDGPVPLYEQLGFVRYYEQWSCFLKLPGYPAA
jgi:GNAT superfamily N-acetyltransferase